MNRLSIRARIAWWNTFAFAVVLVGFGLLIYGLLRQTHVEQVDRVLRAMFQELSADQRHSGDPQERFRRWTRDVKGHAAILGVIFDAQGKIVAQAAQAPPVPNLAPAARVQFDTLTLPDLGRVRRLTGPLVLDERYTVVLLAELAHVDEEMALVAQTLLIAIPMTLAIAAALAYLLAWRSLAPVEQLRKLTDEITADRLDRRLPIANPADELGLLAQTINAMIGRLAGSFTEIRRFTADASHELRTPIAVIRSEAELGADGAKTLEAARERFRSILEECARLAAMTDQLLTLCREDAGNTAQPRVDVRLGPLAADAVEALRTRADAKGQNLSANVDEAVVVRGDAERLRQVVSNLLDNAIKYTPEGGSIRLTVARRNDEAVLEVCDTGIGIPHEHQRHVFERFYRVDEGRSQREGGAGLGLSIVQSIVSAHGGRVEVASEIHRGSVFRVYLPRERAANAGE